MAQSTGDDNNSDSDEYEMDKFGVDVYNKLYKGQIKEIMEFAENCKTYCILNLDGIMQITKEYLDEYQPKLSNIVKIRIISVFKAAQRKINFSIGLATATETGDASHIGVAGTVISLNKNIKKGTASPGPISVVSPGSSAFVKSGSNLNINFGKASDVRPGGFDTVLKNLSQTELKQYRSALRVKYQTATDTDKAHINAELQECNKASQNLRKLSGETNKIWIANLCARDPRRAPKQYMFDLFDYNMFWIYYNDPETKKFYEAISRQ